MRTRYNYGGRYSYGGRYRNGGGPLNSLMKKYEHGGPHGKGSSAFFGVYPEEETEEVQEATRGTNMLPEVEIVAEREQPKKEQPKEEKKKERGFYQIEGDPKSKVIRGGKEMTLEQMNQQIIDEWNAKNPDDKKENILPREKRIDFKGVYQIPISPEYMLERHMRGRYKGPGGEDLYDTDPNTKRAIDMAMREYRDRGDKFRSGKTLMDIKYPYPGEDKERYMPGYGWSDEELRELVPQWAKTAEERGQILPVKGDYFSERLRRAGLEEYLNID